MKFACSGQSDLAALRRRASETVVAHPNILRYRALIEERASARSRCGTRESGDRRREAFEPAVSSRVLWTDASHAGHGRAIRCRSRSQTHAGAEALDPDINADRHNVSSHHLALFADTLNWRAAYSAGEQAVAHCANQIPPYPETRGIRKLVQQFYQIYRSPPGLGKPARIRVPQPAKSVLSARASRSVERVGDRGCWAPAPRC